MTFTDWLTDQAAQREAAGLTRRLVESDRDLLLDLAGNDYLGLARHPRVIAGAVAATQEFGGGARASRLVSGTLSLHSHLEESLAAFMGFPTALAFSTGYQANLAVVTALSDADTLVVSDAHIHASLVDACRLSRAETRIVPHNDVVAVERALAERTQTRALVLAESIYSVFGDAAPLTDLAQVCERYGAVLIVDEAHALGVVGSDGRGLLHAADLSRRSDIVATVTLSKSLGSQGGAVLASAVVRDHLVNRARAFIYDTGLAPAAAGAAVAALEVIAAEPDRVSRTTRASAILAEACAVDTPDAAVLSVAMPGPREAVDAVARAADLGVRIGCFRPPSTPDGTSRLRLTAHAHHTDDDLALATSVLSAVR